MQTRVPEKYLGSNEDATGHGPRLEHAPHPRFVSAPVAVTRAYRDRTFAPLPGHLPHWLGLGYYEQIRYEMLF